MFFFFFSSRRRHTRFDCDWSSDVCSSDLGSWSACTVCWDSVITALSAGQSRSGERRVGEEGRSRWAADHLKKKKKKKLGRSDYRIQKLKYVQISKKKSTR